MPRALGVVVGMLIPLLGLAQVDSLRSARKGYDYMKGRMKIGYTVGHYRYQMSGPDVYMYRANNGLASAFADTSMHITAITDKFTPIDNFRGINIGFESGDEARVELWWTTRKSTSDVAYNYYSSTDFVVKEHREKVRVRYNAVTLAIGKRFGKSKRLTLGGCTDIGVLRVEKKVEGVTKGWDPWFWNFAIFDKTKLKPNTPVVTYGFYAAYDIGPLAFRVNTNFTLLDGTMNSQTYKYTNIPWSTKVFPMANTSFTVALKI